MKKKCSKCGYEKPLNEFNKKGNKYQSYCRKCDNERAREQYCRGDGKERTMQRKKKSIKRNIEYIGKVKKSSQCSCGENHPACLDFHHRNPRTKKIGQGGMNKLARQGVSLQRLQEEIGKCDVMCANCHRKLHYEIIKSK